MPVQSISLVNACTKQKFEDSHMYSAISSYPEISYLRVVDSIAYIHVKLARSAHGKTALSACNLPKHELEASEALQYQLETDQRLKADFNSNLGQHIRKLQGGWSLKFKGGETFKPEASNLFALLRNWMFKSFQCFDFLVSLRVRTGVTSGADRKVCKTLKRSRSWAIQITGMQLRRKWFGSKKSQRSSWMPQMQPSKVLMQQMVRRQSIDIHMLSVLLLCPISEMQFLLVDWFSQFILEFRFALQHGLVVSEHNSMLAFWFSKSHASLSDATVMPGSICFPCIACKSCIAAAYNSMITHNFYLLLVYQLQKALAKLAATSSMQVVTLFSFPAKVGRMICGRVENIKQNLKGVTWYVSTLSLSLWWNGGSDLIEEYATHSKGSCQRFWSCTGLFEMLSQHR